MDRIQLKGNALLGQNCAGMDTLQDVWMAQATQVSPCILIFSVDAHADSSEHPFDLHQVNGIAAPLNSLVQAL